MFISRCPIAVLTRLHSLVMCFSVPTLNFSFLNLFFSILSLVKSEKQLVLPTVKQTNKQRKSCIYMENIKTALQLDQLIFKILWALFWIFCEHSYVFREASPLSKVTPALWARLQWWDRIGGRGGKGPRPLDSIEPSQVLPFRHSLCSNPSCCIHVVSKMCICVDSLLKAYIAFNIKLKYF